MYEMTKKETIIGWMTYMTYKLLLFIALLSNLVTWPVQLVAVLIMAIKANTNTGKSGTICRAFFGYCNDYWGIHFRGMLKFIFLSWTYESMYLAFEDFT